MKLSPMFQQYLRIKAEHRDAILLFRLGDFYEMFFEDAEIASRHFGDTLKHFPDGPLADQARFGLGRAFELSGDRDAAMRIYSCHFITPESEGSSHYFWFQLRNFAQQDEAMSALITEQFILAFDEDKGILEAVQRAEENCGGRVSVKLAIDNAPMRSRRVVERMIRAEASGDLRSAV